MSGAVCHEEEQGTGLLGPEQGDVLIVKPPKGRADEVIRDRNE
jgi:hypothetical protein